MTAGSADRCIPGSVARGRVSARGARPVADRERLGERAEPGGGGDDDGGANRGLCRKRSGAELPRPPRRHRHPRCPRSRKRIFPGARAARRTRPRAAAARSPAGPSGARRWQPQTRRSSSSPAGANAPACCRSTRPSRSEILRRTSSQAKARPSANSVNAVRASKIACLAAVTDVPSATEISACDRPLSSRISSAARRRSGSCARSASSSAIRARSSASSEADAAGGSTESKMSWPASRRRLISVTASLWAMRNSQGRNGAGQLALLKRRKRRGERRLQRIFGVLIVAQHRAAVAVERLVVALVQDRERTLAARPTSCARRSSASRPSPNGRRRDA